MGDHRGSSSLNYPVIYSTRITGYSSTPHRGRTLYRSVDTQHKWRIVINGELG